MNHCLTKRFKAAAIISAGVIALTISSCSIPHKVKKEIPEEHTVPTQTSEAEKMKHYSDLPADDCQLCGGGKGTLLPAYRGQDNVGIISLNTFILSYVEINPYDDNGKPKKKPSQGSSTQILSSGEDGYTSFISENQWRGYAHGTITFHQDQFLDMEKAAAFLCNDCLNEIMDKCWTEEPYGVGIIDFKTGEIRLLEELVTAFIFNDYYITCDLREPRDEDSTTEMDLMIFYCPERYKD